MTVAESRLVVLSPAAIQRSGGPHDLRGDHTPSAALLESIRRHGILSPLLVERLPEAASTEGYVYRLAHGFRRLAAAEALGLETVPAVVAAAGESAALLRRTLSENAATRPLSLLEKARALRALKDLGVPEEELVRNDLASLGLPAQNKIARTLRQLGGLAPPLLRFLSDKDCPLRRADVFGELDTAAQTFVVRLIARSKPGLNDLESAVRMLVETAKREGRSQEALLEEMKLGRLLQAGPEDGASALTRIVGEFFIRRFPELSRNRAKARQLLADLRLPGSAKVRWDETLEKRGVTLQAEIKDRKELEEFIRCLSDAEAAERLGKLLDALE